MSILLLFAFLAGFVTILAPCIWPLLPIVLSASSQAGKQRPLGITLGVMTSFTVFTLSIAYLEQTIHLDANVFRLCAVVVIGLLGVSMMIPPLGTAFENLINHVLSPFQNRLQKQGSGFGAGYATGFSIGLVWAPCAGPILATIATLAATQAVSAQVVMVTLAYVCGLGVPLFLFSLFGSKVFSKMRQLNKYTGRIQQVFGLIMVAAALLIYTNYDKVIQVKILDLFPSYGSFLNTIENNEQVSKELGRLRGEQETKGSEAAKEELSDMGIAPDFVGTEQWLNGAPLSLARLKGKVVLVDFWTYSCVNCVRTLPHVTSWYERYKSKNFVVIGVHTPEFAFEKEVNNVESALGQFKINYPVVLDTNYRIWKAYSNHYWPAEYLIDAKGHIRHTHFGEGKYDQMEKAIRQLLAEAGSILDVPSTSNSDLTPKYERTPETYLGLKRSKKFAFSLVGEWETAPEYVKGKKGAAFEIPFKAGKVFLVIGPHMKGDQIKVLLDGRMVDSSMLGSDVKDGKVVLDTERLYNLLDFKGQVEGHVLRLEMENDGISLYAFTFG